MSCGKLRLTTLLALGICFCLMLVAVGVEGQLNFSTGWGKRSNGQEPGIDDQRSPNSRAFSSYYRHLMKMNPNRRVLNI